MYSAPPTSAIVFARLAHTPPVYAHAQARAVSTDACTTYMHTNMNARPPPPAAHPSERRAGIAG